MIVEEISRGLKVFKVPDPLNNENYFVSVRPCVYVWVCYSIALETLNDFIHIRKLRVHPSLACSL
jgi:hypothetical protein